MPPTGATYHDALLDGLVGRAEFLREHGIAPYPVRWDTATIKFMPVERIWLVNEVINDLHITWWSTILPC